MAKRKDKYKKPSRRSILKNAKLLKKHSLLVDISGQKQDVFIDYVEFLKKLDHKEQFSKYGLKILHRSPQWNAIRKKHITASNVKRLCSWEATSNYIFRKLGRYISNKVVSRGDMIEGRIINILVDNGMTIKYENSMWVHKTLPWISCSIDGAIVVENKIKCAIEIKSYQSKARFSNAFKIVDRKLVINSKSHEFCQIQMIAEIVDVPFVVVIVEFELKIYGTIVIRDLDHFYNIFEKLKLLYFKYVIPCNIYGLDSLKQSKYTKKLQYFSDHTYKNLMKLLTIHEDQFNTNEYSILCYCPDVRPSDNIAEYFDFNIDRNFMVNLESEIVKLFAQVINIQL